MKYVYAFQEGGREQKYLLGGKGANLAEMTKLGLPVPPGLHDHDRGVQRLHGRRRHAARRPHGRGRRGPMRALEADMGKRLGDDVDPLLVSVRSGAPFSMPGMMDTVLNLGLNDESVQGLAKQTGNERFAYDSYRRFVQMFGKIVLDVPGDDFEEALARADGGPGRRGRHRRSRPRTSRAWSTTFKAIVATDRRRGRSRTTRTRSSATRSKPCSSRGTAGGRSDYRRMERIPDDLGTAVNVQTMVFGNKGDDSGTGVAFTRNPSTGENAPYGDFLTNAQGEDVVAGIRITEPLDAMAQRLPRVPPRSCST